MGETIKNRCFIQKNKTMGSQREKNEIGFNENGRWIGPGERVHQNVREMIRDFSNQDPRLSTTGITSRDQIINPYDFIDVDDYPLSQRGQALYNERLAFLQNIAAQQEAAYEEWYNSPEQQVLRDRAAGLNPDYAGLSGSEAANAELPTDSPISGLPTSEEIKAQQDAVSTQRFLAGLQTIGSLVGLATSFFGIKKTLVDTQNAKTAGLNLVKEGEVLDQTLSNLGEQGVSSEIANISRLAGLISGDISDLLATAMQASLDKEGGSPLDVSAWLADPANTSSVDSLYGHLPNYAAAKHQAIRSELRRRSEAAALQHSLASGQKGFMEIYKSPYYSTEQKIYAAQIGPYMDKVKTLQEKLQDLDITRTKWLQYREDNYDHEAEVAVESLVVQGKRDYLTELDMEYVAKLENILNEVKYTQGQLSRLINDNYLKLYEEDPTGYQGAIVAFLSGNSASTWTDAYNAFFSTEFQNYMEDIQYLMDRDAFHSEANTLLNQWSTLLGSFAPLAKIFR